MKCKHLYCGRFIFPNEVRELRRYAYTKRQAFMIMCRAIAETDDMPFFQIYNYFNRGNHIVELEIEYKELP